MKEELSLDFGPSGCWQEMKHAWNIDLVSHKLLLAYVHNNL